MCRNCIGTIWLEPEDKHKPGRYGNDRKRALEEQDDDAYGMDDKNFEDIKEDKNLRKQVRK